MTMILMAALVLGGLGLLFGLLLTLANKVFEVPAIRAETRCETVCPAQTAAAADMQAAMRWPMPLHRGKRP